VVSFCELNALEVFLNTSSLLLSRPDLRLSGNAGLIGWRVISDAVLVSWYVSGDVCLWGRSGEPLVQIRTSKRPLTVSVTDSFVVVLYLEAVEVYSRDGGRLLSGVSVPDQASVVYTISDGRLILVSGSEPQGLLCFSPVEDKLTFLCELPQGRIKVLGSETNVLGVQDDFLHCFIDADLVRINTNDTSEWETLLECGDEPEGAVMSGRWVFSWNEEHEVTGFDTQAQSASSFSLLGPVVGSCQSGKQILLWSSSDEHWSDGQLRTVTFDAKCWQLMSDGTTVGLDALGRVFALRGDERAYVLLSGGPIESMAVWGDRLLVQQGEVLSVYSTLQFGADPARSLNSVGFSGTHQILGVCSDGAILDITQDSVTVRLTGRETSTPDEVFIEDDVVMSRVGRRVSVCQGEERALLQIRSFPERVVWCDGCVVADERWVTGFTTYDLQSGDVTAHASGQDRGEHDGLIRWAPGRAVGWHWDVLFVYSVSASRFQQWKEHTAAIVGCVVLGERLLSWDSAGRALVWSSHRSVQRVQLKEGINRQVVALNARRFFAWGARGGSFWRQSGRRWESVERPFETGALQAMAYEGAAVVALHTDGGVWHHTEQESRLLTQLERTDGTLYSSGGVVCVAAGTGLWWLCAGSSGYWRASLPIVSVLLGAEGRLIVNMGTCVELMSLPLPTGASETPNASSPASIESFS
jgi:hypothetical protein